MIAPDPHGQRRHWLQAVAISLLLHGAALAAWLYQPEDARPANPGPSIQMQIRAELPVITDEASHDLDTPDGSDQPPAQTLPDRLLPEQAPQSVTVMTGEVEQWAVITHSRPALAATPASATGGLLGLREEPGFTPQDTPDPHLAPLIEAIRERLDQPCLIALPQIGAESGIGLTILADNERAIAEVLLDLETQRPDPSADQRVLLDPRQCPGVTYARRSPTYPVFPLTISLQQQDLTSGAEMQGRISAPAGHETALLLVDDNGVVQDLRRFQQIEGEGLRFDVPMARADAPRDTSQLLIAIASRRPLAALDVHDGRLAQDVFPALLAQLGDDVLIGVTSLYLR